MIQRLVIDSNMLQSEYLRHFLDTSSTNFAVLPDFAWFEIYKQRSIEAVASALSVIGDFPEQIVVLKSGRDIAEIDPRMPAMLPLMQYGDAADSIREMVNILNGPSRNEPAIRDQLDRLWDGAVNSLPGMLEGAQDIMTSLPEMSEQMFKAQHLRIIRQNSRFTPEMFSSIFGAADQIWETLSDGGRHRSAPSAFDEHKTHTYLYRYALALVIYLLWWIRNGNQPQKRLERTRNDLIDLSFAVYGTYYEGLMTSDKKAGWMYENLRLALGAVEGEMTTMR
ncbi:hypothetical protein JET14_15125 [Martelella lutilitoris]|uniref:Uncharacterized protein n=1 Tax=Martelella lutilitoris TaxID=2583532 RepID=A0A7T7KKK1_9HYPH|nr:hypothetical protein [Martelella lutilitoris]QQM29628.1 hypothetical protein JET14_15125 [Martelella lutilitoris]